MAMAPSAACSAVSFPARPAAAASSARPRVAAAGARAVCRASTAGAAKKGGSGNDGKWWAPLLGWSGRKADYLEAPAPVPAVLQDEAARRQFVGVMTEEKARELRARMAHTESFHDAMYHSAIASRLARSG